MRGHPPSQSRREPPGSESRTSGSGESKGWRVYLSGDVLVRTAGLSHVALLLLIALEQYARLDPTCFPSNAALAAKVRFSVRWVRRGLAELEAVGWICRVTDPVKRDRPQIVMLRRLDPDKPTGGGGTIVPAPGNNPSRGGGKDPASVMSTQGESQRREEARTRIYSADADRGSRGRERSTRLAGDGPAPRKRSGKPPRMTAREMDAGIREYAEMAGSRPPPSPWNEDDEPFG